MTGYAERKDFYKNAVKSVEFTESVIEENNGFFNFYPVFSPDGKYFAYLSNMGRDYGRTALVLKNQDGEILTIDTSEGEQSIDTDQQYEFRHGLRSNATLDFISNRYSFSPDGETILFNIARRNKFGENYQDLYVYNIKTEEKEKLTQDKRIFDPVWDSQGKLIAAVQRDKGTENLVLFDKESNTIQNLTDYQSGETVYTPVWNADNSSVYYSSANTGNRNIYRYDMESGVSETVFEDEYT